MRVLLIDDNLTDRKVMARILNGLGHEVLQSRNGLDALEQLESQQVDAVVLDLLMPVLNGLETMEQIHKCQATRSLPVIVVSGAGPELAVECLEAGATAYLSKPCSPNQLASKLSCAGSSTGTLPSQPGTRSSGQT